MAGKLKWIDLPPVWLAVFALAAWLQADRLPVGPRTGSMPALAADFAGGLLVGAGCLAIGLAALEMRRARTTVIPHLAPDALVTSGVFARSRNPIYLGDAAILTGLALRWEAWPSLALVPLFVWLITDRFVLAEEARLRAAFGPGYEAYASRVRRWL